MIEVEEDQRQRLPLRVRVVPILDERALEVAAVGDAGQLVEQRQPLQVRVGLAQVLGAFIDELAQAVGLAVQRLRAQPDDGPISRAVSMPQAMSAEVVRYHGGRTLNDQRVSPLVSPDGAARADVEGVVAGIEVRVVDERLGGPRAPVPSAGVRRYW